MGAGSKVGINVLIVVVGIPVGIATKKVVERTWAIARPAASARKPSDPDVRWGDAVVWAALSAAGIVIADLVTRRTAEMAYQAITGTSPPPTNPARAAKKLEQAQKESPAIAE